MPVSPICGGRRLESSIKTITEAYAIVEDNAADPVPRSRPSFKAPFPACSGASIRTRFSSIPASLSSSRNPDFDR